MKWAKFTQQGIPGLKPEQVVLLVAYSLSGINVNPDQSPFGKDDKRTWKSLRDRSVCLLADNGRVVLPYSLLKYASRYTNLQSQSQQNLVKCLIWLSEKVDDSMFDVPPWNLWEKFGVCFHALRINSLCVIGKESVPFSTICSGALIEGCKEEVILQPVTIFESAEKYSVDLGAEISMHQYPQFKVNWVVGNNGQSYVVLNQEAGEGVDIFFSLKRKYGDGYVICVDQRKREAKNLSKNEAIGLLSGENILPNWIDKENILYRGLFSSFATYARQQQKEQQRQNPGNEIQLPQPPNDCFLVSFSNTEAYHSSLAYHPAASPCVNINYDSISYLRLITSSNGADAIYLRRITKSFKNLQELEVFLAMGKHEFNEKDKQRVVF